MVQQIVEVQTKLQAGGRAIGPESLHMTLAYLGPVPRERITSLESRAEQLRLPALSMTLDRLAWIENAKMIWLVPRRQPAILMDFHQVLTTTLREGGFRFDSKPFRPHVTLYRNLRMAPCMIDSGPVRWVPDRFHLVESVAGGTAARYRILNSW